MIEAGKTNKLVTIQSNTPTRDANGGEVESWGVFAKRWVSIEPLNGREFFTAQQTASEITHRVRLRYDQTVKSVNTKMRILFGSRVFDIESVINPRESNVELLLMCREQNNG